jgi:hypothetical protein
VIAIQFRAIALNFSETLVGHVNVEISSHLQRPRALLPAVQLNSLPLKEATATIRPTFDALTLETDFIESTTQQDQVRFARHFLKHLDDQARV